MLLQQTQLIVFVLTGDFVTELGDCCWFRKFISSEQLLALIGR